jgi:DNA-binding HxlR family transcriptional regulator
MEEKNMTLFTDIIGTSTKSKVIEYLLEGRELRWRASEIAEGTNLSEKQVTATLEALVKKKIVKKHNKGYAFNKKSNVAIRLDMLFKAILKDEVIRLQKIK